jgi:hypothetical protein
MTAHREDAKRIDADVRSDRYPFGTDDHARAVQEDVFAKVGESDLLKTLP